MDPETLIYNMLLTDFLEAEKTKTEDDIRGHTITLILDGEQHTISDPLYYEIATQLANQYIQIYYTLGIDDNVLMLSQQHKTVLEVLTENQAMIDKKN